MTTTAFDDQYLAAPEPVRQPYDTVAILRRNIAALEVALRTQTERAEAAEAEMAKARDQLHPMWKGRNSYGLDMDYFRRKLEQVLRDLDRFTPEEFARAMATHSRTADDKVIAKEFAPVPSPTGGELARMQEYAEKWRHAANEWADTAENAFQWLKNIRDGFSTANDAIPSVVESMTHCRRVQTSLALAPAVPAVPDGMTMVSAGDANNYCRILTLLGMEEEGDPVKAISAMLQSGPQAPAVPEEWREAVSDFLSSHDAAWAELFKSLPADTRSVTVSNYQADAVRKANVLRALLQSADGCSSQAQNEVRHA